MSDKDLPSKLREQLEALANYDDGGSLQGGEQVIAVLLFKIYQRLESIDASLDALVENSVDEYNERRNQ